MKNDYAQITEDVLDLYRNLLVPFMLVERDMPFPSAKVTRDETDGEHAFTLAIIAISMNEQMSLKLDGGKIAKYALVHDLVEAYAGDVSVKAAEVIHSKKQENEHKALLEIKKRFQESIPWIAACIENYEKQVDQESIFVYLVDKNIGALTWFAGEGKNWKKYYPEENGAGFHAVRKRLRSKVESRNNMEMLEFFDFLHDLLEEKRHEYFEEKTG